MPTQFSLTDILGYVGSGLVFFVVIALVYPGLDAYKQVQNLSTASGILATFSLYICGYILASLHDLIKTVTRKNNEELSQPFKCLYWLFSLQWIHKANSSLTQIKDEIVKLTKKYSNTLSTNHEWSDDEIDASLEIIASSQESEEYVSRLSALQTFVGTSAFVCFLGIVLNVIQLIAGAYKSMQLQQWLWLGFIIGLVVLLHQQHYLLIEQNRQMWKQACKSLVESSRNATQK